MCYAWGKGPEKLRETGDGAILENDAQKQATHHFQYLLATLQKNKLKVTYNKWTWKPWIYY